MVLFVFYQDLGWKGSFVIHSSYGSSYRSERERLYTMLEEIQKANSEEFKSTDEVFNVFARAQLSGRLLPLARLIEKTYGKGSFRKLGKETSIQNDHDQE